jgi:transposase-like protein
LIGSRGIAITIASNGRELEQMQKIIKDCKLQVEELPKPIPENLWNSVQCLEGFSLDQSLNVSQTNESIDTNEEYNPFNRFTQRNDLSNESQKQWMSYNDIVNEYNIIKKSIENNTQSLLPLGRTDSQNALQQTNCDSIEKVFADKCLITTNDSDLELETQTLKFEIIDKCDQKREESETLSSDENDCQNESQYNLYENPVENGDNQKSFENNFSDMNHLIESGFNQWSTALFPPISNVSNPSQYNEWMNTNRHLWSYMINPFRSFELTQNVNQNSFNNNKRPLNKKQTES